MKVTCPDCKGRGMVDVATRGDETMMAWDKASPDQLTHTVRRESCSRCAGTGQATATGRIPVLQDGRCIGTVPASFDPLRINSQSWMYTPRPGDFERQGDAWVASLTMGPGDLEAVPGFVWQRRGGAL